MSMHGTLHGMKSLLIEHGIFDIEDGELWVDGKELEDEERAEFLKDKTPSEIFDLVWLNEYDVVYMLRAAMDKIHELTK